MKFRPLYLIVIFLLFMFYLFAREAKAEVQLEIGATNLSGDWAGSGLLLSERFGRYDFGIGYISEQTVSLRTFSFNDPSCTKITDGFNRCDFVIRETIFISAQRIVKYKKCEMGIGPSWWQNTSRVHGAKFNFGLMIGCNLSKKVFLRVRHWSNGGSATPNLGQDLLTIGYRF